MTFNFTFRLYSDQDRHPVLTDISELTISEITLLSKYGKFEPVCFHKGNQKKFGYTIEVSKKFFKTTGSHSGSHLAFKGEYVDIVIKNFPRYPSFCQCKYAARNILNGGRGDNHFPIWHKYRKFKFIY